MKVKKSSTNRMAEVTASVTVEVRLWMAELTEFSLSILDQSGASGVL
jgi:hypothetical protein